MKCWCLSSFITQKGVWSLIRSSTLQLLTWWLMRFSHVLITFSSLTAPSLCLPSSQKCSMTSTVLWWSTMYNYLNFFREDNKAKIKYKVKLKNINAFSMFNTELDALFNNLVSFYFFVCDFIWINLIILIFSAAKIEQLWNVWLKWIYISSPSLINDCILCLSSNN